MRNLIFSIGFIALFATNAWADAPACFKTRALGRETCRVDGAVADIDGGRHFLVWGGKDSRGCDQCTRMVVGNATGGLYDQTGHLVETMAQTNAPGPRFGAQALWNGAAFFVWGGTVRQNERWTGDQQEIFSKQPARLGAFYLPVSRTWIPMTAENAPASGGKLGLSAAGLVQVCDDTGCSTFDMATNVWTKT